MITKISLSFIVLVLFPLAAFANNIGEEQPLTKVRLQQLTHLVKQDCGSCHGMTLKGGLGTPLLPEDLEHKSVEFITFTILNGRPSTAMPPWLGILTPQEATWIAQQLKQGTFNEN